MDTQILISEFVGTAVLMAFGSGVNSSVLLKIHWLKHLRQTG